jgi:ribosomal protein S20
MDEIQIKYTGKTEDERIRNAQYYSLISNLIKKLGLELSYNEQYALFDGMKSFVVNTDPKDPRIGEKFKIPKLRGKNEKERVENVMFATLLQNVLQRFTMITEDERAAIDALMSQRIIPEKVEED